MHNGLKKARYDRTGINSENEPHMHQLTLSIINKDQMMHEWVFFENGKPKQVATFDFRRRN